MDTQKTITITFGERAENHRGFEMIGSKTLAESGFTVEELRELNSTLKKLGYKTELIDLNKLLDGTGVVPDEEASLLIIREIAHPEAMDEMTDELLSLQWDAKAIFRGQLKNKRARHNLTFDNRRQEPDYEKGKGRIIHWDDVPTLAIFKEEMEELIGGKAQNLVAEGNLYYDITKCGIGFHGDSERKITIALRLGESMVLEYQWYQRFKPIGKRFSTVLNNGDFYIMSEKATGWDWKRSSIPTLRHAAGCKKYVTIKKKR